MVLSLERTSKLVNLCDFLLKVVGVGSLTVAVIGLTIPTQHRDKSDIWDVTKNWTAIGLVAGSGSALIWTSQKLEKLKPEMIAIEKAQSAQSKHAVASWLYQANKLHTDIAQSVVIEQSPLQQNQRAYELEAAYQEGLQEGYEHAATTYANSKSTISLEEKAVSPELVEMVEIELNDGKSDSYIIQNVLGMKGRYYQKGKEMLREIKQIITGGNNE